MTQKEIAFQTADEAVRKEYDAPEFQELGDVTTLTQQYTVSVVVE